MQPCFIVIINNQEHDYTRHVEAEGMQIEKNDRNQKMFGYVPT